MSPRGRWHPTRSHDGAICSRRSWVHRQRGRGATRAPTECRSAGTAGRRMKTSCSTFESVARRRRAVAAGEGRECPAPLSLREGRRGEGILICLRSTVNCQNAHSPRMLREGARSVHGPCLVAPGLIILSRHVPGLEAGGFGYLSGMRVLGRYAGRQPNTLAPQPNTLDCTSKPKRSRDLFNRPGRGTLALPRAFACCMSLHRLRTICKTLPCNDE